MNIVFDIGNVLLAWDPRVLYRKIFKREDEVEWFLEHICTGAWNTEQDRGRSFSEAVTELQWKHPEHHDAIAAYDGRWSETLLGPIDGTVAVLEDLHKAGARLYAITNWNGDKFRETRQRYPFLYLFRDIVVSGDEKLIKPDPAIYNLLLERNKLRAAECLFIDDSKKNVIGAEAVGMRGHHFTTPDSLRLALRAMGILA